MIRLLTALPRASGLGEYVAQLGTAVPDLEVHFGRPMSLAEYETTTERPTTLGSGLRAYWRARRQPPEAIRRTHVLWEGFGPIYGRRTRLMTVHHVLPPSVPWERWPPGRWRRALVFAAARRGQRRAAALGIRVVTPSESTRRAFLELPGADPAAVVAIPHYIDTSFFAPIPRGEARRALDLPAEVPVLLHIGTDDGRKNIPGVIELFRRVRANRPDTILVQIGRSPTVAAAVAAGGPGSIRYLPRVDRATLPGWYSAASAVLLPTFLEGFGNAALEAHACGTPAIVSDIPVFREELGPHLRGAPPGDWVSWVGMIERVLETPPAPGPLRAAVVSGFPADRFRRMYRALYEELGLLA